MKKSYRSHLILFFLIIILTLYIINSNLITKGIINYTKLFINKLFPTSFIIFTISSLLINYQIINLLSSITKSNSSALYVIIMSMISGFPSGPKYIKELYEKNYLDKETGNYLLTFTHFANPIFIITATTTIIKNKANTLIILLSLTLSNFIVALIFKRKNTTTTLPKNTQESFSKALNKAIFSSLKTLVLVYGTCLFFYLISLIITHYIKTTPIIYILINGLFDLTKGIFSTPIISSTIVKSLLIIFFVSFGSISIHIQIKSILSDTSLNYKYFLLGRIISSIITILIFIIVYYILKIS